MYIIIFLQNEEAPVPRICYASMKHVEGDVVRPRDCILLASGNRKRDLPFVAKVTALWENPEDGMLTFLINYITGCTRCGANFFTLNNKNSQFLPNQIYI